VQDHPQGVDVRALVWCGAAKQLRGHVLRRAGGVHGGGRAEVQGHAEVGHEEATVTHPEDVLGFEVAMDDPRGVDGGDRAGDGPGVGEPIGQGALRRALSQ
jgi:hypothetical protein